MAANRSSPLHEATLQANWLLQRIGRELRLARIAAGMTQRTVAERIGRSKSHVSRAEHGQIPRLAVTAVARHAAAVGMRFSAQLYPGVRHVLDAPQLTLLNRLRERIGPQWSWELEVPMPTARDLRAVDARVTSGAVTVAVEAITRLADVQAQVRAAQLKRRDIGATRLLLLVGDTNANRRAIAEARPMLAAAFLLGTRRLLAPLSSGNDPGRDILVVL
ncbi:MAG TPA: helix-turn-helix transcriptional regulator [Candidatus Limnocylindria bacterium]